MLVLCYHAVSERWSAPLSVKPDLLERQLSWLLDAGYVGATFREAVLDPPARRTLAVTFDDAYRSVIALGLPVLNSLKIPGTVFAPTSFIGSERPMSWPGIAEWATGSYAGELIPMSWDELGELADRGWEIGSHTRTHARLPAIEPGAAREELERSRADCEARLGVACRSLAYPYGEYNARILQVVGGAGYTAAGAVVRRPQRPRPLAWPRVGIYRRDSDLRFRLKVSPAAARLRASRAWRARRWLRRDGDPVDDGS